MKKVMLIGAVFAAMLAGLVAQSPPAYCTPDHWNPYCEWGHPTPFGSPYFSCSTTPGDPQYCCKYMVQNHTCSNPPPAVVKFFDYTGYAEGTCGTNQWGQWCPDMPEPTES